VTDTHIILFIITSLVVIITPGQDMVLVLSRGITQGSKAGVITAAGVSLGLLGHTLLTSLGLGAFLMASDIIFTVLKYIGALYLVYLGVQLITSKCHKIEVKQLSNQSMKQIFTTGALSNISNPKVTIFYFAYLPQFISSNVNEPALYLFILGVSFALLTFLVKGPVGYLAGKFSVWITSRPTILKLIDRTSGTILIGLGVKLALEERV